MSPRYEANPGLDPQLEAEATQESRNQEMRDWEENPDRWKLVGEDPLGETTLENALLSWWPEALQAPTIQAAGLTSRQRRLLARMWMVDLTDHRVRTPKPTSAPQRVARYLEQAIGQVRAVS